MIVECTLTIIGYPLGIVYVIEAISDPPVFTGEFSDTNHTAKKTQSPGRYGAS